MKQMKEQKSSYKITFEKLFGLIFGLLLVFQFAFGQKMNFQEAPMDLRRLQDDYPAQSTEGQDRGIKEAQDQKDIRPLPVGEMIERQIGVGDLHQYRFRLEPGQVLQVDVLEKGVNVQIILLRMADKKAIASADYGLAYGRETLTAIVEQAGTYIILVSSLKSSSSGSYLLMPNIKKIATARDWERIKAEQLFAQGLKSLGKGKPEDFREAVVKGEEALPLWKKLGDQYWEGYTNTFLGVVHDELGEPQKAIEYLNHAGSLYKAIGDRHSEAATLNRIGKIYSHADEKQKAIDSYNLALPLARAIGDKGEEASSLYNTGRVYFDLNDYRKALDYYKLALPLYKDAGDKDGEASTLNGIGQVHSRLGEKQQALSHYNLALPLWRGLGNKSDEATTLHNIGYVYYDLGDNQKALEYLNLALTLRTPVNDKRREAATLNIIGHVYSGLGEQQTALNYLNQALPLAVEANAKIEEASVRNNIADVYMKLGEKQKSLDYYNQALELFRAGSDRQGEAVALSNIGALYSILGENEKALDYLNRALLLRRAVSDRDGEAATLSNIGIINFDQGKRQDALDYLNKALTLTRAIKSRQGETVTLGNIGIVYSAMGENEKALDYFIGVLPLATAINAKIDEAYMLHNIMELSELAGNRRLAIFFGKQSVNILQRLRERDAAQGLDNEFQRSFVRNAQNAYQGLTELLIEEGLFDQAIQILNLYQDQRLFDFDRTPDASVNRTAFSPREDRFARRYESESKAVGRIGSQIEELKLRISNQPDEPESAELAKLEAEFKSASNKFLAVLADAEAEFAKPPDQLDIVPPIKEVKLFQETLRTISRETKQKTVALYTLIGFKNFRLLLVSPDGIKSFGVPVESDEFDNKVRQFYALLQSDDYDTRILGKELYDLILKPAEAELKKQDAQILLWSLNGTLRYVPMAALSPDGKSYLIEHYQHAVFTRAEIERITRNVSRNWTGIGFGSSQAHSVNQFGDKKEDEIPFEALPSVVGELKAIFKTQSTDKTGIIKGEVFVDDQFTKESFYKTLQSRRSVVHISSHFIFRPGDDARSFLLLGNGKALPLNELKKHKRLFAEVELLTLSACKTAATQSNDYGKEVDGFAELAQRLGAGSVIATLWQVRERSTAQLMVGFYRNREIERLTKAEALRTSQLDLLYGRHKALSAFANNQSKTSGRGDPFSEEMVIEKRYRVSFKPDKKKPFAHPYYWSPFILFGNWR